VPQAVDLFAWRNTIMSADGPRNPLVRLVLMAISLHMRSDGTGAWPAQSLIATRAGVGERTVRRHLDIAARQGWISRVKTRRDKGRAWYRSEYEAMVPDAVHEQLPQRPWEVDRTWRRQPATVAATHTETDATVGISQVSAKQPTQARVPANGVGLPATQARVPVNSDSVYRPELGRLTLPVNSSYNSSLEGALARTPTAREQKTGDQRRIEQSLDFAIQKLPEADDETVRRAVQDATLADVRAARRRSQ
jgi:hypothetical protein